MTASKQEILIQEPTFQFLKIGIRGTSPLLNHRWTEKAKRQMFENQQKTAKKGREARNPMQEVKDSLYMTENGEYGFPTMGFKSSMVRAGQLVNLKMTFTRMAFFLTDQLFIYEKSIVPEFPPSKTGLIKINGVPQPDERIVRVQMGTDFRFRGIFPEWDAELIFKFIPNVISAEQIANLLMLAGFSVGVGENRPEKDGQFGTWEIVGRQE